MSATSAGILLGMAAEKMYYESYGIGGWLGRGSLLAAAVASPLLCANALMSGRELADISGTDRPARRQNPVVPGDAAGVDADRDHADRRGNRAGPDVRSALARFSVRRPDHGRGAVLDPDPAQPSEIRHAPDRRGRVRRPVRRDGALRRLQRRSSTTGRRCGLRPRIFCSAPRSGRRVAWSWQAQHRSFQTAFRKSAYPRQGTAFDPIALACGPEPMPPIRALSASIELIGTSDLHLTRLDDGLASLDTLQDRHHRGDTGRARQENSHVPSRQSARRHS